MRKLYTIIFLFCLASGLSLWRSHAQMTFIVPNCGGSNDTTLFTNAVSQLGSNIATIRLPYKGSSRCVINSVTLPSNITLDDSDGSGISVNSGQTLTLNRFVGPRKKSFYGSGTVTFSAGMTVFPEWWGVKADAVIGSDGATTNASNVLASATKTCSASSDTGKAVFVYGAGSVSGVTSLNNVLRTTVTGCSGGSFTMTASASATTSSKRFVYGTDNVTAMQAAASSLSAGGTISIAAGNYMLGAVTLLSNTTVIAPPGANMFYSTSTSVLTFSNKSNVTIDGIGIDAGGNPLGNGAITLVGGTVLSNIRVQNCYFTDSFLTNNLAPVSTFNRHGVLLRDQTDAWVLNNTFEHALRIKAAGGSVGESNTYIVGNILRDVNENGISLLSNGAVTVRDFYILNNVIDGVMATGNGITIGDDGSGGASQEFRNIFIEGNTFKGALPANTSYIQDKGSGVTTNISISRNKFYGATLGNSSTFAINKGNQSVSSGDTSNFHATGNEAYGDYGNTAYRFGNISSGIVSENLYKSANGPGSAAMRLGAVSNLKVRGNSLLNCNPCLRFTASTFSNIEIDGNTLYPLGINNAVAVSIDAQSSTVTIYFLRNRIFGPGGTYTNVYAFEDNENGAGDTDGILYIDNRITNWPSGAASRFYQTLPTHGLVIEPPGMDSATFTTGTTPSIRGKRSVTLSYSGAETITDFLNGYTDQAVTLTCTNGNATVQNNSSIKLAKQLTTVDTGTGVPSYASSDFVCTADSTLTLRYSGSAWVEVARGRR